MNYNHNLNSLPLMKSHTRTASYTDTVSQAPNSGKFALSRVRTPFSIKESEKTERSGSVENLRINLRINLNKKFGTNDDNIATTTLRNSVGTQFTNL